MRLGYKTYFTKLIFNSCHILSPVSITVWAGISVVSVVGISVVSIGIWVGISVVSVVSVSISIGLGLWLSISRSLAIVISVVSIWVSIVSMVSISVGIWVGSISIGVWVGSISIVSIQSIGISLWLSFSSNSCKEAESSNSNGFHFDVIKLEELAGLPMYSALI